MISPRCVRCLQRTTVFDLTYTTEGFKYEAILNLDNELLAASLVPDAFEVYDNTSGEEIFVKEVQYTSANTGVVLVFEPEYLFGCECRVKSTGVMSLSGEQITDVEKIVNIKRTFDSSVFGMFVKSVAIYSDGWVLAPQPYTPFRADVTVVNASVTSQTGKLTLAINDNEPFLTEEVTLEAGETREFAFNVDGIDWQKSDILNAKIEL